MRSCKKKRKKRVSPWSLKAIELAKLCDDVRNSQAFREGPPVIVKGKATIYFSGGSTPADITLLFIDGGKG